MRQQGDNLAGRVSRETWRQDDGSRTRAEESASREVDPAVVSRETTATDPLEGSAEVRDFFGPAFPAIATLLAMLSREGVERGLIGPHELGRLWERHALNSADAVPLISTAGQLIDVCGGAACTGIALAVRRTDPQIGAEQTRQ